MNSEIKQAALIMTVITALSVFTACESDNSAQPEETTTVPVTQQVASTDETAAETTAFSRKDDIVFILDSLKAYTPGTAGSSLKLCTAAFPMIDFSQEYDTADADSISATVGEYMSSLTDEEKALVRETIAEAERDIADTLFSEGFDAIKPRLDDAGNPNRYTEYDKEKYDGFMAVFKAAVGE